MKNLFLPINIVKSNLEVIFIILNIFDFYLKALNDHGIFII